MWRAALANPAVRKVLALDPKNGAAARAKAPATPTAEADAAESAGAGQPAPTSRYGWEVEDDTTKMQGLRTVGRVIAWAALLIVLAVGLRTMFAGGGESRAVVQKAATTQSFPTGEAQAVAARFASAYLTLSGEGTEARDARLALLRQDSPADLDNSWDGRGQQKVLAILPGQVNVRGKAATVEVLVQVERGEDSPPEEAAPSAAPSSSPPKPSSSPPKPSSSPAKPAAPKPSSKATAGGPGKSVRAPTATAASRDWVSLSVPVQATGTRVIVTGDPAFTSLPDAGPMSTKADPSVDEEATRQTHLRGQAFFQAWAGGDSTTLSAATAPGSTLSPLPGLTFKELVAWQVFQTETETGTAAPATPTAIQTGDTRVATARVMWQLRSGARLTQTYTVTLRAVSGGGITDWRVSDAHARTTSSTTNTKE